MNVGSSQGINFASFSLVVVSWQARRLWRQGFWDGVLSPVFSGDCWQLILLLFPWVEGKCDAVVAIAHACGFWPIIKPVALMAAALSAVVFRPRNQEFEIRFCLDGIGQGIPKAWPACATLVLCFGTEQWLLAACTAIGSRPFLIVQRAAVWTLRCLSSKHSVGRFRQFRSPLGLRQSPF